MPRPLPDGIDRPHILDALARLDAGASHDFADSTRYDVHFEGRRYPPKAVVGLAAEAMTGERYGPYDFTGGLDSTCFRVLERNGFEVIPKAQDVELGPATGAGPAYWWVNQNKTYRAEIDGGYLWSPKRSKGDRANPFYDTMREVRPGDLVFSFAGTFVKALGVVVAPGISAARPEAFGQVGNQWEPDGWQVDVEFHELGRPFRPVDILDELVPTLPAKYSPIRTNGKGNQGVYLARVPGPMAAVLLGHVDAPEKERAKAIGMERAAEVAAARVEDDIRHDDRLTSTEKMQLVKARRGQGVFRTRVEQVEAGCRVTGVREGAFLVASHIKPWRVADNVERLDGSNGLLLSPHVDRLFDRGYLTFEDDGTVRVSTQLSHSVLEAWCVLASQNVGPFSPRQRVYLAYHREHVFKSDRSVHN